MATSTDLNEGDTVYVTMSRPEYYGLSGEVVGFIGIAIRYVVVKLFTDSPPPRLAQMPTMLTQFTANGTTFLKDVYTFTFSQVERSTLKAAEVLGDGYFD